MRVKDRRVLGHVSVHSNNVNDRSNGIDEVDDEEDRAGDREKEPC